METIELIYSLYYPKKLHWSEDIKKFGIQMISYEPFPIGDCIKIIAKKELKRQDPWKKVFPMPDYITITKTK